MRVAIRADASLDIGTGHIYRCLALANALRAEGHEVEFFCCPLEGNLIAFVRQQGFPVHELLSRCLDNVQPLEMLKHADWLVVDHYQLDSAWESAHRDFVRHILVVDDLADRPHDCDVLLDQNYFPNAEARYQGLVPDGCRLMLGPSYALLRSEFSVLREAALPRSGPVTNVLISFGGSDTDNITGKVVEALGQAKFPSLSVSLLVGASNPHRQSTEELAKQYGFQLDCAVSDMAERMARADLFIGAGGSTTWERLCLGLPGIVLSIADNQVELSRALAAEGYQFYLGAHLERQPTELAGFLHRLLDAPHILATMSRRGMELVDGLGTGRVVDTMTTIASEGRVHDG